MQAVARRYGSHAIKACIIASMSVTKAFANDQPPQICPVNRGKSIEEAQIDTQPAICPVIHEKPIETTTFAVCPVNMNQPIEETSLVCPIIHSPPQQEQQEQQENQQQQQQQQQSTPLVCPVNHGKSSIPISTDMIVANPGDEKPLTCPVRHIGKKNAQGDNLVNPTEAQNAYLKEPTADYSYDRSKIDNPDFVPGLLTIPSAGSGNSNDGSTWVQPSPEQIFRAVKGKGMDIEEQDAFLMALYHSDVVEATWKNIIHDWEQKYIDNGSCQTPTLRTFEGLYAQDTLKARAANLFFKTPLPYDRHDWLVDRCGVPVRYIVEYYDLGPQDGTSIDVRPALDSFTAAKDRIQKAYQQAKDGQKWY